ncbi:MAG: sulfotransferase family 2 domain-containing protein [Verrucomicrobiota bacterium]
MSLSFRKLASLKKRILACCTGRENVHFLHLRKTGGTTLKSVLGPHQITPKCVLHLHPHRFTLRHTPKGHRVMFVTRDPVSRYVSGFGSRLREGAPAHHVPWSADEEFAFSRFPDPNSLALALDTAHPAHADAVHAMRTISHLQCSYWDWFGNEEELAAREDAILFIGRVESFDADFELLKKPLGLPPDMALPKDSKSTNRSSSDSDRRPPLEPAAVEQVKKWYRRDYDFLTICAKWRERQGGPVAKRG